MIVLRAFIIILTDIHSPARVKSYSFGIIYVPVDSTSDPCCGRCPPVGVTVDDNTVTPELLASTQSTTTVSPSSTLIYASAPSCPPSRLLLCFGDFPHFLYCQLDLWRFSLVYVLYQTLITWQGIGGMIRFTAVFRIIA